MARVRPFRAFRYASKTLDVTSLTAPPYDVIDEVRRAELLDHDAHNVVALELPEGPLDRRRPGNRYEIGARRWSEWQRDGIVVQDEEPGVYVLEQAWTRGNAQATRLALIAAVGLERFEDGIVLPHERTLPRALDDRLNLTRACAANFSQVLSLYSDPAFETATLFEKALQGEPIARALGDDGVESRLWALSDTESLRRIEEIFAAKQIFIADGHHRYTTALTYRDEQRMARSSLSRAPKEPSATQAEPRHESPASDDPPYDFVLMALANMDDPELVVLPTHRVADAPGAFDADAFWQGVARFFDVEDLPPGHPSSELLSGEQPRFIVQTRDGQRRLVRLKQDVDLDTVMALPYSAAWKHLDVAVLQELVLSPLLGIHPDRPETLDRLAFVKDAHEALKMGAEHDVVVILRATRLQQLRDVALAGETMPQKSTYFFPKVLSGLVMRSLGQHAADE